MEDSPSYRMPWIGGSATILRIARVFTVTSKAITLRYSDGSCEIWASVSVSIPPTAWDRQMIKRLEKRPDITIEAEEKDHCVLAVKIDFAEPEQAIRQIADKIAGALNVSEICPGTLGELE